MADLRSRNADEDEMKKWANDKVAVTVLLLLERSGKETYNSLWEDTKRAEGGSLGKASFRRRVTALETLGAIATTKSRQYREIRPGPEHSKILHASSLDLDEVRKTIEGHPPRAQVEKALDRIARLTPPRGGAANSKELRFWQTALAEHLALKESRLKFRNRALYQWASNFRGMSLDWAHLVGLPRGMVIDLLHETLEVKDAVESVKSDRWLQQAEKTRLVHILGVLEEFDMKFKGWAALLNKLDLEGLD